MSETLHPTTAAQTTRDGFLDAVKVVALWRVVVWHAVAWPWLSWFAAMPAMFYVAGVLLQQSLDKRGVLATARARVRRLLVPFWVFGIVAGAVMAAAGWRPRLVELVWWIVPVVDPGGAATTPGLWIPLWYLRAYLWVVVAAGVLAWGCRRFGSRVLIAPAVGTAAVWVAQRAGWEVPLPVADAALFSFFVLAGMLTASGRLVVGPRRAAVVGVAAALLALGWSQVFPAPGGVVHGSLPLHLLTGVATLALLGSIRGPLASPGPVISGFVSWSTSRALTIYLWHGMGLVIADRTVRSWWSGPGAAAGSLAVVILVTLAATVVLGGVEDRAATRRPRPVPRVLGPSLVPAAALVVLALSAGGIDPARVGVVPSGQAVVARAADAEMIDGDLGDLAARGSVGEALDHETVERVFQSWLDENSVLLDELDTGLIEVALVDGGGDEVLLHWARDGTSEPLEPFPWWSMSKSMTTAWMMQLVEEGVISLDAPLAEHLDGVPHGEEMTFEQLASHRAGLPSGLDRDILSASPIDEIGAFFADPALAYPPGEGYDYSRVGYHLLTWGLEEASGSSWREAMEHLAAEAGVSITIDEDYLAGAPNTHPGDGDYRGALWGAGGLHGTTRDGAHLFRWTLMEALDEETVRHMATTEADLYGLGLMPMCPCVRSGDLVSADRVGLSTITGSYVVDLATDIGLMLRTDNWWGPDGPALEFDDLTRALLDSAAR